MLAAINLNSSAGVQNNGSDAVQAPRASGAIPGAQPEEKDVL